MSKFEIRRSKSNSQPYYFVLIAENGEVIATSETYTSKENVLKGIDSVKKNASTAVICEAEKKLPDTVEKYLAEIFYKKP
ncbi:YegP family protein [Vibrio cholerae]|nr:YegP family protein [Vibrio cholerae]